MEIYPLIRELKNDNKKNNLVFVTFVFVEQHPHLPRALHKEENKSSFVCMAILKAEIVTKPF